MGFPTIVRTWVITANNVIADATLALQAGNYMRLAADFLLANGYTCAGSSDGVTAAMDGVNRWTTIALASVRGTNTTTPQSWMVVTDANGCDLLLAHCGSADSHGRFGCSLGGLYVAAATATHTPTATDELLLTATGTGGQTIVGTNAAPAQRNMFGWVDSTAKNCRFVITLNSTTQNIGTVFGLEEFDSSIQELTIPLSVWGFCYTGPVAGGFNAISGSAGIAATSTQGSHGGRTRINGVATDMAMMQYSFLGGSYTTWMNVQTELQGGVGYPIWDPFLLVSQTSGRFGIVGHVVDWWSSRYAALGTTTTVGDTYNAKAFMVPGVNGSLLWPWDGVTTPVAGVQASIAQSGNNTGFENFEDPAFGSLTNAVSQYVPNPVSNVTPTGPATPKSINRRAGVDVIRLHDISADPAAETGRTLMYSRVIGGQQALFCVYADGTVYQVGAGAA